MEVIKVKPARRFSGTVSVPGDKSISHRAAIIGSLAEGDVAVSGYLGSEDCLATLRAMQSLGVPIDGVGRREILIHGVGLEGLKQPKESLDLENSGTGLRLLAGLLSGFPFSTVLTGDNSLCRRPMGRIIKPLGQMGAEIRGEDNNTHCPIRIRGKRLTGINYKSPVASAQVKGCLLLAGLSASGKTTVTEPLQSRDHTERMLQYLEADLEIGSLKVTVTSGKNLRAKPLTIPGDISSAAFIMAAAAMIKNARVIIKNVGINPTRTAIIDVLKRMGASLVIENKQHEDWEPAADIIINGSELNGIEIDEQLIPGLIDELPILAVAAATASGRTTVTGAAELRVKESDRIRTMAENLKRLGAVIEEKEDGWIIEGGTRLNGNMVNSYGDHRIAMAMVIAGLVAEGETIVSDTKWIATSFPGFMDIITSLSR